MILGARAYYMHSVLHDWPNDMSKSIVDKVREAMKPGYSRLLINENVIPNTDAWWEATGLDILMMIGFCASERTESDWRHLLEDMCGLKIIKIWSGGRGVESLIECEVPQ